MVWPGHFRRFNDHIATFLLLIGGLVEKRGTFEIELGAQVQNSRQRHRAEHR